MGLGGGHLTKGHPAQSSTKLGHKMSLQRSWEAWGRRVGVLGGGEIHLTTGQPAQISTKVCYEISQHRGAGGDGVGDI